MNVLTRSLILVLTAEWETGMSSLFGPMIKQGWGITRVW